MLKLLRCPFSLVLFIYNQSEACWFVGVTWPALIFFFFLAVNPATPSLGDNFFPLASWFIHMLLWKHGGLIMQMREDQPKNWFKEWKKKNSLGYDSAEMRKLRLIVLTKTWVHVWVIFIFLSLLCIPPKMETNPP